MKKNLLLLSSFLIIMSACSKKEHLNKEISTIGSMGTFQIGEKEEYDIVTRQNEKVPVYMSVRVNSVIDDITPKNPEALMPENYKSIKVNVAYEYGKKKPSETDFFVFDTKSKKEYMPTLRDNESNFGSSDGYFIVDVPNTTAVEDLTIGMDDMSNKNKTHEGYIDLKPKTIDFTPNRYVKLDSVVIIEDSNGKTKTTLKGITYNVDNNDKNIDVMTRNTNKGSCFAKVDMEIELMEGDKAYTNTLSYLFSNYRALYTVKETVDVPFSIEGKGTVLKSSYYFCLWPGETIDYIGSSDKNPDVLFKINPKAQ